MPSPPRGVALRCGARDVLLKWHMLRRVPDDPAHERANLGLGLARGAVVEVDLRFSADGVGLCLHDATLEAETTGRGAVADRSARELAALRQRDAHGRATEHPPLRLDEVAVAVRRTPPPTRGAVQLDLKAAAGARSRARFAEQLADVAEHFTLSGEVWPDVVRLAGAAPGIRLGFEPLPLFRDDPPRDPDGFRALAGAILQAAPEAEIVYLHAGLALAALQAGEDLIGRLVDAGRAVDCWTVDPHRTGVVGTLERLAGAGCHQITTNGPEALDALWREAR